jgi:TIR domain
MAPRDILPGADWGAAIMDALDSCRAMVLIFSSNANESPQIRREVERVVGRGMPIIPVRIEETAPTKALAYFMGPVHWLDALTPPLEQHLQRLADSLKTLLQVEERKGGLAQEASSAAAATSASAAEVATVHASADSKIGATTDELASALSPARMLAMKCAVIVAAAIGVLLTIATIVYQVFGWLPVAAALAFISFWLVYRNLTSQRHIAKIAALGCGLVWAYLAIWNAAGPNIPLVVIEGIASGCLLYVSVELARVR